MSNEKGNANASLRSAAKAKNDEFYTQLSDIENELYHYREHFEGKTILCNCDDPFESNFFKYFALNFEFLKLKKLIAVAYADSPIVKARTCNGCGYVAEMSFARDVNGDTAFDWTDIMEMQITERKVAVRDLVNGYKDDGEKGVVGYDGRLDIRPIYQREFVYDDAQRNEVINTILRGLPLNVIYWVQKPDGNFEVLDGQQRTVSICRYVTNGFAFKPHDNSMEPKYYSNLPDDYKDRILNYELIVYVCNGTESEKLEWFKIINIAGEQLTNQELRNAVYAGSWITDAKHYFSSSTSVTNNDEFKKYLKGSPIRQEYLETALTWAASKDGETIEEYMAKNQHLPTAINLWNYFRSVTDWIKAIFPQYRKEMKGLPWGIYYNVNHDRDDLDPVALEDKVKALMEDEDVTRKSGIYEYVLDGQERVLSIRAFDMRDRRTVYEAQSGNCALCGQHCEFDEMQADHIVPWSKGGKTVASNCQMLCRDCNLKKSNK